MKGKDRIKQRSYERMLDTKQGWGGCREVEGLEGCGCAIPAAVLILGFLG